MRRAHFALLMVAFLILVAVFILARLRPNPSREIDLVPHATAADALDLATPASTEHEERGIELDTALDPSVENWSRRSEARAIEPAKQSPKPFTTRRLGGGGTRLTADVAEDIRDHALSWCAIVGIAEEKRKDVADLVVRTQRKWLRLCDSAGAAQSVNTVELEGLREWRRDELGRLVGFETGDALIAGIKAKQGF